MNKSWFDYFDERGMLTQKTSMGGDGGDSLNRTSAFFILNFLLGQVYTLVAHRIHQNLGDGTGKYRRSWHPKKWYSEFNRTSRDQLTPLVILCGLSPGKVYLRSVFFDHLKRLLLFTYNTRRNFQYKTLEEHQSLSTPDVAWNYHWKLPDLTGPEFWALYIRGFNCKLLYPVLCIFDLHTLLGSVVIRYNTDDDVINHALILEFGRVRMDTPVMWLARKVTPRALLQARLDQFFGKEIEPPLNELYRNLKT